MTKIKRFLVMLTAAMMVLGIRIYASNEKEKEVILPVLMYHNISEEYATEAKDANITPELFRQHMQAILDRGYTPIFINEYYDFIIRGKELPENPIAITFDDGYLSNYEIAYPILKELNIPATIFIVTSTVGLDESSGKVSTPHFTWDQAREMQESGIIDIHSHSHSHKKLDDMSLAELQFELRMSKYLIERNLEKYCYVFSYPYGRYNEGTLMFAKYAGYRMQIFVTDTESDEIYLANKSSDGIERFTRLTVSGDMSVEDLYERIDIAVKNTLEEK